MPRYAKKNTIDKLCEEIVNKAKNFGKRYDPKGYYETDQLISDMIINGIPPKDKKIVFDFENLIYPIAENNISTNKDNTIVSFYQLGEFAIMLCLGGGDWEIPVYFAIYIDDNNKLRMYVPTKGNSFNPYTKTAYGSEEETELDHIKVWKSLPKEWKADPDYVMEDSDGYFEFSEAFEEYKDNLYSNIDDICNINEMLDDIKNRIVIK